MSKKLIKINDQVSMRIGTPLEPVEIICDGKTENVRLDDLVTVARSKMDEDKLTAARDRQLEILFHLIFSGTLAQVRRFAKPRKGILLMKSSNLGRSAFYIAASHGRDSIIRWIYNTNPGLNVNETNAEGLTPAYIAAQEGHLAALRVLIEHCGCNPRLRSPKGYRPLMIASLSGHLAVSQYLIEHTNAREDINAVDNTDGAPPLMTAAQNGHLPLVKYLVGAKADVPMKTVGDKQLTVLYCAARSGDVEMVRYLVQECGVDINAPSETGGSASVTAVTAAACDDDVDVVHCLCELKADISETPCIALFGACEQGSANVVRYLATERGIDVNQFGGLTDEDVDPTKWRTALYTAMDAGHVEVVRLLLKLGADITPLQFGRDILWNAFDHKVHGDFDPLPMMRVLIEGKAAVNTLDETGSSLLHKAADFDYVDIVRLLCEAGADVELGAVRPLLIAAQLGHLEVVRVLAREYGADVNADTLFGKNKDIPANALRATCENGNIECLRELVALGADMHYANPGPHCETPSHACCYMGQLGALATLAELKCDVQAPAGTGCTPIELAAHHGRKDIVSFLTRLHIHCHTVRVMKAMNLKPGDTEFSQHVDLSTDALPIDRLLPCSNPACPIEAKQQPLVVLGKPGHPTFIPYKDIHPDFTLKKKCAGCGKVQYCGRPCQAAHWKNGHKKTCSRNKAKAPAAAKDADQATRNKRVMISPLSGKARVPAPAATPPKPAAK